MPDKRSNKKVFGIGMGRTGSLSLARAMSMLGFKSRHAPKSLGQIYKHDFINDIGISWRYRFLDYAFPTAKFILTIRDTEPWLDSNERWGRNRGGHFKQNGYLSIPLAKAENRFMMYGVTYFDREMFTLAYSKFVDEVISHFKSKKSKLLIMNICGGEGWKELCEFVGEPVPENPFPHIHRTV